MYDSSRNERRSRSDTSSCAAAPLAGEVIGDDAPPVVVGVEKKRSLILTDGNIADAADAASATNDGDVGWTAGAGAGAGVASDASDAPPPP